MTDTSIDGAARVRDRVRAHPLAAFFLLAYAFSWSLWPVHAVRADVLPILPCGPFLAAVVVLGLTRGRAGVGSSGQATWKPSNV